MGTAEYDIGTMYENGWGVSRDYVKAQMWYILATSPHVGEETVNLPVVTKDRDSLAAKMTPEQIAEAQKLAREWKPQ